MPDRAGALAMSLDLPPRRERVFNIPIVVVAVCAALLAIQALASVLSPEAYSRILIRFAFVPGRFTFAFDPKLVSDAFNTVARTDELRAQIAAAFLGDGTPQWWTVLTYACLHGGWAHVGVNCLWLVAFGGAVAKRLNGFRFLMLLAVSAIAGAGAHYITHMADLEPVVGASASVSGAMGAAARFVFQPGAPLDGAVGGRGRPDRDDELRRPALSLWRTLTGRRTLPFILIWFASNFLFGAGGVMPGTAGETVAWQAHIGGFLAGLLLFGWFDPASTAIAAETESAEP